jgi:hypothetical protein
VLSMGVIPFTRLASHRAARALRTTAAFTDARTLRTELGQGSGSSGLPCAAARSTSRGLLIIGIYQQGRSALTPAGVREPPCAKPKRGPAAWRMRWRDHDRARGTARAAGRRPAHRRAAGSLIPDTPHDTVLDEEEIRGGGRRKLCSTGFSSWA